MCQGLCIGVWVFQGLLCMGVSRVFEVNIKGVRRQSQGCLGALHWHFKGVTKVLQERCYKGVTMVIHGFYKGVVWVFHLCCHNPNSTTTELQCSWRLATKMTVQTTPPPQTPCLLFSKPQLNVNSTTIQLKLGFT